MVQYVALAATKPCVWCSRGSVHLPQWPHSSRPGNLRGPPCALLWFAALPQWPHSSRPGNSRGPPCALLWLALLPRWPRCSRPGNTCSPPCALLWFSLLPLVLLGTACLRRY